MENKDVKCIESIGNIGFSKKENNNKNASEILVTLVIIICNTF